MEATAVVNDIPWTEIAIAGTQVLIALALVWLTWKTHSTQMRIQRALKVQEWGNDCIELLAEADHFCVLVPEAGSEINYLRRRNDILRRLSASIDRGRMFFENENKKDCGQNKPPAYQGFRPKILDPLVAAYLAIETLSQPLAHPDTSRKERLFGWRKYFVSLLQKELNPEWLKKATKYNISSGGGAGLEIGKDSVAPSEI